MEQKLVTPPDTEPITLSEAKSHLKVLNDDEDNLIESEIQAAREYCENVENRAYYTQTRKVLFDELQYDAIKLPRPPLQSIDKVEIKDADGNLTEITDYDKDIDTQRVLINEYPDIEYHSLSKLQITYTCGNSSVDDIRGKVKQAIKLLVGHMFEHRKAVLTDGVPRELKLAVNSLLNQDRVIPV